MKLLYVTQDRYPPFRADVVELFARQMPARGHTVDWLMQRGLETLDNVSPSRWLGNLVYLRPCRRQRGLAGRVNNNLLGIWGDLSVVLIGFRGLPPAGRP
ncbi:MAG: hypothetical protein ACRERU_02800 [Methylococcales bacterium]